MSDRQEKRQLWRVENLKSDYGWEDVLFAAWEVALDPISDDYTPEEINAHDLFKLWVRQVQKKYPDGLIPIYWFIQSSERGLFELMPFQFKHNPETLYSQDFLSFFNHPVNVITGERLNWLTVPVIDKLWQPGRANKGGFIQEATNWKPNILQPSVYLPALTQILFD